MSEHFGSVPEVAEVGGIRPSKEGRNGLAISEPFFSCIYLDKEDMSDTLQIQIMLRLLNRTEQNKTVNHII